MSAEPISTAPPRSSAPSAAASRLARDRLVGRVMPVIAVLALVALWAAAVRMFQIPDYLLPAPQDVVARIVKEWRLLLNNGAYTLMSVLVGFLTSVAIAVPIAFGIVLS